MPITRKQFELGITPKIEGLMKKAHEHLAEHRDHAFSVNDLKLLIQLPDIEAYHSSDLEDLEAAMDMLARTGAVEARIIRNTKYYSYTSE